MRKKVLVLVIAGLGLILSACGEKNESEPQPSISESTSTTILEENTSSSIPVIEETIESTVEKEQVEPIVLEGDENFEEKHVITADEAGSYTVKALFVPMRDDFYQYNDYSDLLIWVTIFSEAGHDSTDFDSQDLKLDEFRLTTDDYYEDVAENYSLEQIQTEKNGIELDEGNEVQVLNGKVELIKED